LLLDDHENEAYERVKNLFRGLETKLSAGSVAYFAIFWLVGMLVEHVGKERTAKLIQAYVDDIDEELPVGPTVKTGYEDDRSIPIGTSLEQQVYGQITKLARELRGEGHSFQTVTYWVFSWWLVQMVQHTGNKHTGIILQKIVAMISKLSMFG
jgi:hypothetical protein